jgi:hypothetical protein
MDANHVTAVNAEDTILAVSLELSAAQWKVALHDGFRDKPAVHTVSVPQADVRLQAVLELITQHSVERINSANLAAIKLSTRDRRTQRGP